MQPNMVKYLLYFNSSHDTENVSASSSLFVCLCVCVYVCVCVCVYVCNSCGMAVKGMGMLGVSVR